MTARSYTVEYHREYYLKNKDKIRARYLENREEVLARAKEKRDAERGGPAPVYPDRDRTRAVSIEAAETWVDERPRHGEMSPFWRKKARDWASLLRRQLATRARNAGVPVGITVRWVREQFERQGGRCLYTGIPFEISTTKRHPWKPSLDRVDPSRAYTPDNTVLCLCAVNYLKNDYPLEVFQRVLEDIRSHRP